MNHYIAHDEYGLAIMSVGRTAEEATATAIAEAGPLFDAEGAALTDDQARAKFIAMRATPALIAQVEAEGGGIAWGEIDGTACTIAEEEAANADAGTSARHHSERRHDGTA